jgi:8-oxo-dGTP diphosphatase
MTGVRNKYGGVYLGPDELPRSREAFPGELADALQQWREDRLKVAWLLLPAERADLVPIAVAAGFQFHHCSDTGLMLAMRLSPDSYLPAYATHTIGVGAVVISDEREILTVVERRDLESRPDYFKLPGGMLERGEHFADGAVRETLEETGVNAEFVELVSLRHHHRGQFGTSNIYVVCRLKPLTRAIVIDETEIGRALWLPVDEYLAHPGVGPYNRRVVSAALGGRGLRSCEIDQYMDSPDEYEAWLPSGS